MQLASPATHLMGFDPTTEHPTDQRAPYNDPGHGLGARVIVRRVKGFSRPLAAAARTRVVVLRRATTATSDCAVAPIRRSEWLCRAIPGDASSRCVIGVRYQLAWVLAPAAWGRQEPRLPVCGCRECRGPPSAQVPGLMRTAGTPCGRACAARRVRGGGRLADGQGGARLHGQAAAGSSRRFWYQCARGPGARRSSRLNEISSLVGVSLAGRGSEGSLWGRRCVIRWLLARSGR